MQGPFLRKYGVETKITFVLFETDGVDFKVDAAHASGDTKIMKDEGAEANTANAFVDEGQGYSITLSATEMEAARNVVYVVDQGTKAWLDTAIVVETYGNASAMHAFDLDTASSAQTGDGYAELTSGTYGLSVIEALVDELESRVTAARAGYLDELGAANIPADIDTLLTRLSAARAGYIDNINGHTAQTGDSFARLGAPVGASVSADVAAVKGETASIKAKTDNLKDSWNDLAAAAVNAQVVDALATDTYAEPGQGAPAATATLAAKINYLFKWARNQIKQTSTTLSLYNDAADTVDHSAAVSDDGETYTRGEIGSGA